LEGDQTRVYSKYPESSENNRDKAKKKNGKLSHAPM